MSAERHLPSLTVELLVTFVVTADVLCMGEAADLLHLSASGVSRRIKGLETVVGSVLFVRHTRSMALSPAGRALLPHAVAILDSVGLAATAIASTEVGDGDGDESKP